MTGKRTHLIYFLLVASGILVGLLIPRGPLLAPQPRVEKGKVVTKVIDGDTVLVEGETVRLSGIDADERGYPCYQAAKRALETKVLGKEVTLKREGENKGQYGRLLRYIFLNQTNINQYLVERGLAVARVSDQSQYKQDIIGAESEARKQKIGCKWEGGGWTSDLSSTEQKGNPPDSSSWDQLQPEQGLKLVEACEAEAVVGQSAIVEGKIVDSHQSVGAVFLNFGQAYPNACFTAVIRDEKWSNFPKNPEEIYLGRWVRLKGRVKEYEGRPELILSNRSQLEAQ